MALIDFTEIPEAHRASGMQDSWELFAADYLALQGYEIVDRPSRGPDLGKDLIINETRKGIGRETIIRWLVSCKHKAHSGRAVGLDDEPDIIERVENWRCSGFMGFYSTLPSSSLLERLKSLESRLEFLIVDRSQIEGGLLSPRGSDLARRYFPQSTGRVERNNPTPAEIFDNPPALACEYCGRDLLNPPQGVYALWRKVTPKLGPTTYADFHVACKGSCDRHLSHNIRERHNNEVLDAWEDLSDFAIPVVFLQRVIGHLNGFNGGDKWSEAAFTKFRTLIVSVYPHVARHATSAEQERVHGLMRIPSFLGGLGYE